MKFSQRIGLTPVSTALQVEDMSDDLRNSLWSILVLFIWNRPGFMHRSAHREDIYNFSRNLWIHYFKRPVDEIKNVYPDDLLKIIRDYYFECPWYEVYDFLEYVLLTDPDKTQLVDTVNIVLENELSGYRFVESAFVPITNEVEVESVQKALTEGPFSGVHAHLKQAMEHLSRKENPDYRNSIKESISAVESMAREITGNPKSTLGEALTLLEKNSNLHPALKKGFSAIYGYTSDEGGIRHAMLDEPNITVADAKFFLVSCSTFINYLKSVIPTS
ncbi:MAG: hypothetical protein AAGA83_21970 [Cyanobacteria bacterium P01_F01_bin.116]